MGILGRSLFGAYRVFQLSDFFCQTRLRVPPDAPNVVTRLGWVGLGLGWVGVGLDADPSINRCGHLLIDAAIY